MSANLPQTFNTKTGSKILYGSVLLLFSVWVGLVVWMYATQPPPPLSATTWPAHVMTVCIPVTMFVASAIAHLTTVTSVTVDDRSLTANSKLKTLTILWSDASSYDVDMSEKSGLILTTKSGQKLNLPVNMLEGGAELAAIIQSRIDLTKDNAPIRSSMAYARLTAGFFFGLLIFFALAIVSMGAKGQPIIPLYAILALVLVPISVHVLTYRATLIGNTLRASSCFGSKQIAVGPQTYISVGFNQTRGGTQIETLTLINSDKVQIRLTGTLTGYAALKARIVQLVGHLPEVD